MKLREYVSRLGIPGAISALGLLAAWIAIVLLLNGELKYSILCAAIAFILDSLDGYVARKMNKVSELGRQLDSMMDLIGYSVYSALLVYRELLPNWQGVIVAYTIILFGILRLIRFNTDGYTEVGTVRYYRGIVTCHLSLAAIGLLLLSTQFILPPLVVISILLTLSFLQLSNLKTRKTGMLPVWYTIVGLVVVGALLWLP